MTEDVVIWRKPLMVFCTAMLASCASAGATRDADDAAIAAIQHDPLVQSLVSQADLERYKSHIRGLAQFGDREQGTPRNRQAVLWLEAELKRYGYTNVVLDRFFTAGGMRENIYATKVGTTIPGEMYIISAHLDGIGGGQAVDDDASGCAVVLEIARILAAPNIRTQKSVRFVFWNAEESGLEGSRAYAGSRSRLQGQESPPGSGNFPEPRWLGVIQHDMMLFDHGKSAQREQIRTADVDIEYKRSSSEFRASASLAALWKRANVLYASMNYPAEVGNRMTNTDSDSFAERVASISVRENQRGNEIGRGSNPRWHRATDTFDAYSDDDFRLGLAAAKTSLGAIAHLVKVSIAPGGARQ